jgi:pimeloyl-ACP methyl ester carboxylesterase
VTAGAGEAAIRKPSLLLTLTEPIRAAFDVAGMFARLPELIAAPRGDGHTVVVLPGFATSDLMTQALRNYLSWLGYDSEPWRLGYNTGYIKLGENEEALRARMAQIARCSGEKVSLVGWSLGGTMARQMAREHPEWVRRVITLGSPFTGNPDAIAIRRMYERISRETLDSDHWRARFERDRAAPGVPTSAIYSPNDGITAWQNCVEEAADHIENIEVGGSHLGLTHNPQVLLHIAEILARA